MVLLVALFSCRL